VQEEISGSGRNVRVRKKRQGSKNEFGEKRQHSKKKFRKKYLSAVVVVWL
jgi:hypothetical protein